MEEDAVAYDEVAVEADHEEAYVQDDDPSYQEDRAALDPDPDPDLDLDQVHLHDADASYVAASVHHAYVVVLHVAAYHDVVVVQEIQEVQVVLFLLQHFKGQPLSRLIDSLSGDFICKMVKGVSVIQSGKFSSFFKRNIVLS